MERTERGTPEGREGREGPAASDRPERRRPGHFHGYRWQGERRAFDRHDDRRPAPHGERRPTEGFLANRCTPLRISDWLLRPAEAVSRTLPTVREAAAWFREEAERAAPAFAVPRDRERLGALAAHTAERLAWGGDVHAGWYVRGTGYFTLDVIGCAPNRTRPELPCPLHLRTGRSSTQV